MQLIRKHVDPQWLSLHTGDATLRANVIAVLEDESFQAEVDAERATLRAAADAPTDLQAHEPSDRRSTSKWWATARRACRRR